jgi:Cu2+-exporting ATPase
MSLLTADLSFTSPAKTSILHKCIHCASTFAAVSGTSYCCRGCQRAHELIARLRLSGFYTVRDQLGTITKAKPANQASEIVAELYDEPQFQENFVTTVGRVRSVRLLVPDLSCYACVWLCEQALRQSFADVEVEINLAEKSLRLRIETKDQSIAEIVRLLRDLGYSPLPGSAAMQQQCLRSERSRLGVAWLAAVNIMAFAAAEYVDHRWFTDAASSLDPATLQLLHLGQVLFMVPVLGYAARPFFQSAWRALMQRQMVIDIPIVVSLVIASSYSLFSAVTQSGDLYFDSLSAGVALLLTGRSIQHAAVRRVEQKLRLAAESHIDWTHRLSADGTRHLVSAASLRIGDELYIYPGDVIPVDALVRHGASELSLERITGEVTPATVASGTKILGQSLNLSSPLVVEVSEAGAQVFRQRMDAIVARLRMTKAAWSRRAEKLSSAFFIFVCCVAALAFFQFGATGIERAVAILLIACPCAFGFAIPLSYAQACYRGIAGGIIFKSQHAFEYLAAARHFIFDKTGTLTTGTLTVTDAQINRWDKNSEEILLSLCSSSLHPASRALRDWCLRQHPELDLRSTFTAVKEHFGSGVELQHESGLWRLGSADFVGVGVRQSQRDQAGQPTDVNVYLGCGSELIARFTLGDQLCDSTSLTLAHLRRIGMDASILSGDHSEAVAATAEKLGIPVLAKGVSPFAKLSAIKSTIHKRPVVMIGNGVNDAMAIAGAAVGIATANATAAAKQAADIVLDEPGIAGVAKAVEIARTTVRRLRITFAFALFYNLTGMVLAFSGYVGPMLAAVLMPLASLVIIRLSTMGESR